MKKNLTTNEAADLLGIARTSLLNWIEKGDLPYAVTPGGHRRFLRQDLVAFAEKHGFNYEGPIEKASKEEILESKLKRVLVVDDDEDFRRFACDCLDLTGDFEVREAGNGLDAALSVGSWKPHLVILDLCMPKMDGYEFCQLLNNHPDCQSTKIIIVSGYTKDEQKEGLKSLSYADVISKPIGIRDFVDKIREIIK